MESKIVMEYFFSSLKALIFGLIAALVAHLLPLKQFVGVTFLMVVFDLITGIQAAKKRGEKIHSNGLRRTAVKFAMYCLAIIGGQFVSQAYFPTFPMVYAISCYICVAEFWSVLENVGTVTGTNVLAAVREQLGKIVPKDSKKSE